MMKTLLFVLISLPLWAQTVELDSISTQNITSKTSILIDETSSKSFEQIQKGTFSPFTEPILILPASAKTVWVKITFTNKTNDTKDWVLENNDKRLEHNIFYIPDQNNRYTSLDKGTETKQNRSIVRLEAPHIRFELLPNATKTFYIQLYGARNIHFQAWVSTPEEFEKKVFNTSLQNMFLIGALSIRVIYVLFLALFAVKNRLFRSYVFMLVVSAFLYFGMRGMLGELLTKNPYLASKINFLVIHSFDFSLLVFAFFALPLRQLPRYTRYVLWIGMVLNVLIFIVIGFSYNWFWVRTSTYLSLLFWAFMTAMFIVALVKKYSVNWYLVAPFLLSNSSFMCYQMINLGWFGSHILLPSGILSFNFMAEFIFFGYFLGKIITDYERGKIFSEKQLAFEKSQAEKLTELDSLKTRFFANISHEFRTPLTLILSPLKDLQREFPGKEVFRMMQQNAERLLTLINQLLDLSKLEAGKMEVQHQEGDVVQLMNYLFSSFESLAVSKKILFHSEQNRNYFISNHDEDKLAKITTNLLSNAFKFTPENGRVQARVAYSDSQLVMVVQDYGIGISAERLPRIFDRFYQAESDSNRNYEGTGIGLALVKELVEVLQGSITVESTEGKGTTFTVRLPMQEIPKDTRVVAPVSYGQYGSIKTEAPTTASIAIAEEPTSTKNVLLIVEDNLELRTYIRNIFSSEYQIIEAGDGLEGIEKATAQVPDVIICDLMMPRMDGFGLCKAIKSNELTSHIPVVMLTAKATIADRLEGLELGADDYLAKPFDRDELAIRVRNLVKQRQTLQAKYGQQKPAETVVVGSAELQSADKRFMERCEAVLEQSLGNSGFDLEGFAEAMSLSVVQLRRKLKALTGQGVTEYVRNYRLEKASELLIAKTGTVSEIAYKVGFESLSYFSKIFVERYGKTPSEWAEEGKSQK